MTDKEYIGVTANQLAKIASDLRAENAKLREQIHWLERGDIMHVLTDQEYVDQCERERLMQASIDALDAENAELRELLADAYDYINHPADSSWTHMRRKEARDSLNGRIRELGIEGE